MTSGAAFEGVWVSSKDENYDDFLKAMDIGFVKRGMAKTLTTTLNIKFLGDGKFNVKSTTGPQTRDTTFEIGQEVENKNAAGNTMRGKWEWDGEAMVCDLEDLQSGKSMILRRTIEGGKLKQFMKTGEVDCTRWFEKK